MGVGFRTGGSYAKALGDKEANFVPESKLNGVPHFFELLGCGYGEVELNYGHVTMGHLLGVWFKVCMEYHTQTTVPYEVYRQHWEREARTS